MPTSYTHTSFGEECIQTLPKDIQDKINNYPGLFYTGVHGPDIFFYYDALRSNDVIAFGNKMHFEPAKIFFTRVKEEYPKHAEKDAMLSYILGFLTHFVLDSCCHGYVDRKKEVSNISHNKVEAEYDAYLMRKIGRTPSTVDRAKKLEPNEFNARIISYFFDFDEKTILKALKGQKKILDVLHSTLGGKKKVLRDLIDILKLKGDFGDLFIDNEEDPICKDSNLRLDKLKDKALKLYPILADNLLKFLNDEEELIEYFNKTFEADENYKSIVILSYEEELNYIGEKE